VVEDLPRSNLLNCLTCGLKFRHPVLAPSKYDALYDNDQSAVWSDASVQRNDWPLVAEYLAVHAHAGAQILDFGCYTGGLLALLGPRYARTGVEVNAKAREIARQRTGADVVARLEEIAHDRQFDFVTAIDVLEHFVDPGAIMESLLRVTKAGGTVIATTGNADAPLWGLAGTRWWYCFFPEHLAFISERWVRHWLATRGANAQLAATSRFRYAQLSAAQYARQACLTLLYFSSPRAYRWLCRALKRTWGKGPSGNPPGAGLTKDHLFLAIRKSAPEGAACS
jgi:2-polyprenyl-3-methyl-5-hydroxy-6-metoxy-1,4-benzoquinol methylase